MAASGRSSARAATEQVDNDVHDDYFHFQDCRKYEFEITDFEFNAFRSVQHRT